MPETLLNGIKDILKWVFYVDFDKVASKVNFQEKFEKKFKLFFDITKKFQNLKSNSSSSAVISISLPAHWGGQKVNILDLTIIKPLLDWGKLFTKFGLWISFVVWIVKLFEPRFGIN